jgi:hypothetical protein
MPEAGEPERILGAVGDRSMPCVASIDNADFGLRQPPPNPPTPAQRVGV